MRPAARTLLFLLLLPAITRADAISCLGRIEPIGGVIVLAGPSGIRGGNSVISELLVDEGDWVKKGEVLAVLDDNVLRKAELHRQRELKEEAQVRLRRLEALSTTMATSKANLDEARYKANTLGAELEVFEAREEMSLIRAPLPGQILKIYTQPGEKVGQLGVLELGQTDRMTVVAEVYETDIAGVGVGQNALITNPAFDTPLKGKVIKIGLRVGKMDVLSSDPVADTDARVIETTILLENSDPVKNLTNMQVNVEIER